MDQVLRDELEGMLRQCDCWDEKRDRPLPLSEIKKKVSVIILQYRRNGVKTPIRDMYVKGLEQMLGLGAVKIAPVIKVAGYGSNELKGVWR